MLVIVCMYVCMYLENIYVRAEPYSLERHRGANGIHHCALEDITDFTCAQN